MRELIEVSSAKRVSGAGLLNSSGSFGRLRAGSSTAPFAKCANGFAQADDKGKTVRVSWQEALKDLLAGSVPCWGICSGGATGVLTF